MLGIWTRDIEVVTVSGTGLVVMVSVTGTDGVSVMVFGIETWRFPALDFWILECSVLFALTRLADLDADIMSCPLSATSGRHPWLFNHLVGGKQKLRWNGQAHRFGGL